MSSSKRPICPSWCTSERSEPKKFWRVSGTSFKRFLTRRRHFCHGAPACDSGASAALLDLYSTARRVAGPVLILNVAGLRLRLKQGQRLAAAPLSQASRCRDRRTHGTSCGREGGRMESYVFGIEGCMELYVVGESSVSICRMPFS